MGTLNFYRKFIPQLSKAIKVFTICLRRKIFEWKSEEYVAFEFTKQLIEGEMELGIPNIEIEMKLTIDYDEQTYASCLY